MRVSYLGVRLQIGAIIKNIHSFIRPIIWNRNLTLQILRVDNLLLVVSHVYRGSC